MALQLSKEINSSGVTGDYWKIVGVQLFPKTTTAVITFAVYKDVTCRTGNKSHLARQEFTLAGANYVFSAASMDLKNPIKLAYEKLKTDPFFVGSVDC